MAKRKAARATGRKKKAAKQAGASRSRSAARKASARKGGARKAPRKSAGKKAVKQARATARKTTRKSPRRVAAKKAAPARKSPPKRAVAKKTAGKATARKAAPKAAAPRKASSPPSRPKAAVARKVPALNRARRTVTDEDLLPPSPPSSLNMNRTASAARTGHQEMLEKLTEHTESSPALTAGDVDADWESAFAVGDEAPGGDNMTPDQDVVDEIGKALGVVYEDNEELKGEKKISDRDKQRWELDPASAEDYPDHDK